MSSPARYASTCAEMDFAVRESPDWRRFTGREHPGVSVFAMVHDGEYAAQVGTDVDRYPVWSWMVVQRGRIRQQGTTGDPGQAIARAEAGLPSAWVLRIAVRRGRRR